MSELQRVHEDLDEIMSSFFSPITPIMSVPQLSPVDVYEKNGNLVVKAELPGLTKDDVEITAMEDGITLSGEFKCEQEESEGSVYRHERRVGRFLRTIPLPAPIKVDKVKASFKDGILEIVAPKVKEVKPTERKIPVEP